MAKDRPPPQYTVKVYHGYGHTDSCIIFGHVFEGVQNVRDYDRSGTWQNIVHLVSLFLLRPKAGVSVRLWWGQQEFHTTTASDGFFTFHWSSDRTIPAGWHEVVVEALTENGSILDSGKGKLFVPHLTQFGIISDIDDTVLVSHSSTSLKRLLLLLTRSPRSREGFDGIVHFYQWLALVGTEADTPNPFCYVSSSEWNLYNDLVDFFRFNRLPEGSFLLNQVKRWYDLLKSGKTKHSGKLLRIVRIVEAFPRQRFILIGDNSQLDPSIYRTIANKYGNRIVAVFIRSVVPENDQDTQDILREISEKGIPTQLFRDSDAALDHAKLILA